MRNDKQQSIFTNNLNNYINQTGKTQREIADAIGVSAQTFNTWCQGKALPRMGKIQALADYFRINKSDLIEEHKEEIHTIAAHHDSEDWTQEELNEIEEFKRYVLSKRKNK